MLKQPVGGNDTALSADKVSMTPILSLFVKWEKMRIEHNSIKDGELFDRALSQHFYVEDQIASMQSTCMADMAAKYLTLTVWGVCVSNPFCSDSNAFIAEAVELVAPFVAKPKDIPWIF